MRSAHGLERADPARVRKARSITPQRTWRLYGANEVARLNEALALKTLGLSLSRIADLLDGKSTDLGRTLAVQREALEGICQRAQRGLAMIGTLQDKLAGGATFTITDLTNLAKESSKVEPTEDAVAWRRYEQNRPRTEVSIDPSIREDYQPSEAAVSGHSQGSRVRPLVLSADGKPNSSFRSPPSSSRG